MKKYLFICLAGKNRSPTAKDVARDLAKKRNVKLSADFLGINTEEEKPLGRYELKGKLRKYDKIFVMKEQMRFKLLTKYLEKPEKVISLNIPDIYYGEESELKSILEEKLDEWII